MSFKKNFLKISYCFTYIGGQIDDFESEAPASILVLKATPCATSEISSAFRSLKICTEVVLDECHNGECEPLIVREL